MSDSLASFRELSGIGPATEARLHEAGLYTWEALAEVLSVVGRASRGGSTLRELSDCANARASEARARRRAIAGAATDTTRKATTPVAAPVAERALVNGDPPRPEPTPAPSRHHVVILDAGKAIGGAPRELTLAVSTAGLAEADEFGYEARLSGRALGRGAGDSGWRILADDRGVGHPPQTLPLTFAAPALAPGVHRLRLELALRLASPRRQAPALALSGGGPTG
jgi:hypothetical protein